jgi:hypothetical protein
MNFLGQRDRGQKKTGRSTCPFLSSGAEGGTRTRTDCSTRPSNVRGYQLRHLGDLFFKETTY